MNVTATTTDEQILAPVVGMKRALTNSDEIVSAEALGQKVQAIAYEEGRSAVRYAYRNALAGGATVAKAKDHVVGLLLNGADDAWSGRGNDVKRSIYDGKCAEVQQIVRGY